ncbi:MAG: acyl-CoA reductase, partial [Alistipes sp.]|nr:acyl-CoA reductase [Alistipes sp.]
IAPSNVPVNFAYSLVSGLLTGNANIVRVPSKDFKQVSIIAEAFKETLKIYDELRPYVTLVRYERDKCINDFFSSMADVRIVWGGDATIEELRKSPLPPRSGEITFADRYSLAVIDSDSYIAMENKEKVAEDFYNDTFLTDQNACTSPRIVVWTGTKIEDAKELFWAEEHRLTKRKYTFQAIQAVNKLTSTYLAGTAIQGCRLSEHEDNRIIRIQVSEVTALLMDYRDNSGFFFEYDCKDIMEIRDICNDKHCQTIGYIGNKGIFEPLIRSGVKGIDRIVPIGKTMDFDLIWDGYDLVNMMTRTIAIV